MSALSCDPSDGAEQELDLFAGGPAGLLVVPGAMTFFAYRLYIGERKKHRSLEFLYDTTRELHGSTKVESALMTLLSQARDVFRANVAEQAGKPVSDGVGDRSVSGFNG
jgi:hypothetical protein